MSLRGRLGRPLRVASAPCGRPLRVAALLAGKEEDATDLVEAQLPVERFRPVVFLGEQEGELGAGVVSLGQSAEDECARVASIAIGLEREDGLDLGDVSLLVKVTGGDHASVFLDTEEPRPRLRVDPTEPRDLVDRLIRELCGRCAQPGLREPLVFPDVELADDAQVRGSVGLTPVCHQQVNILGETELREALGKALAVTLAGDPDPPMGEPGCALHLLRERGEYRCSHRLGNLLEPEKIDVPDGRELGMEDRKTVRKLLYPPGDTPVESLEKAESSSAIRVAVHGREPYRSATLIRPLSPRRRRRKPPIRTERRRLDGRKMKLVLGALAAALALVAIPTAAAGPANGTLNVVHGIPGVTVDVCARGAVTGGEFAKVIENFNFGTITPLALPEGSYDARVVIAGTPCTDPVPGLSADGLFLPAGANVSVVASLKPGGGFQFVVSVNDTSSTRLARATVVHAADAPAVDIQAGIILWIPKLVSNLQNGQSASKEILPFTYTVAVIPAGKGIFSFVKLQRVRFPGNTNTVVYAVGSLADGSFKLLTQRIPLG